ncbi:MAG: hypothetical protein KF765_12250 [Parvibaculaceae bacterium]|nr:hypothetical protein [Parvibaculaceae bacterium]
MAKKPTKKMLRIHSTQEGFRRAGIAHPKGATDYELDAFSKKQREDLEAEPMLVVVEVDVEVEDEAEGDGKGKSA